MSSKGHKCRTMACFQSGTKEALLGTGQGAGPLRAASPADLHRPARPLPHDHTRG